jgi:hypothetical protein
MSANKFTNFIAKINTLTEIEIINNDGGKFYWEWRCAHGELFDSQELALIDCIKRICNDYESLLAESCMDDEDEDLYSAIITFKNDDLVVLEFLQPLKLKMASKISTTIRSLNNYEGIEVDFIPDNLAKEGFLIKLSGGWEQQTIAKKCLRLLKAEGLDEDSIQVPQLSY